MAISVVPDRGQRFFYNGRLTSTTDIITAPATGNKVYIFGIVVDIAGTTTHVVIGDGTVTAFDSKQTTGTWGKNYLEPIRMTPATKITATLSGGSPDVFVSVEYMIGA